MPGGLTQPVECRLVGAHLIGVARVEERDQDIGEHVAGEQDATVREEDRGVADGVRLMLDDLARHGSAVRGQRGDERDQLERDARRASPPPSPALLSGFGGKCGAGRGGVARHVAEPGMPEQVVPVGMGGEPGDHRDAEPVQVVARAAFSSEPSMPGSTRINPSSPRTTMELVQTHSLCRTQTPSAT